MMMVVAVGITLTGEEYVLGFVETGTENAQVLTLFLQSLGERGLDSAQGLLVIIDGGGRPASRCPAGVWLLGSGTTMSVAPTGKCREAFTQRRAGPVADTTATGVSAAHLCGSPGSTAPPAA